MSIHTTLLGSIAQTIESSKTLLRGKVPSCCFLIKAKISNTEILCFGLRECEESRLKVSFLYCNVQFDSQHCVLVRKCRARLWKTQIQIPIRSSPSNFCQSLSNLPCRIVFVGIEWRKQQWWPSLAMPLYLWES